MDKDPLSRLRWCAVKELMRPTFTSPSARIRKIASLLLATCLAATADDTIEVGEQLVIHFEFGEVPDTGNATRPVNGLLLSLGGLSTDTANRFVATLYDGFDQIAPSHLQQASHRWLAPGATDPNFNTVLYDATPILDGTIEGRIVIVNEGPFSLAVADVAPTVRAAHFAGNGGFFSGGNATITRREIVGPAPDTELAIRTVTSGTVTLEWTSESGRVYAFQRWSPADPRWRTFAVRTTASGGAQTQSVIPQGGPTEWFRMEVVP